MLRRALAIGEIGLDRADPAIAAPLNNVAELLRLTNRPREAEPFLRRAIAVVETCHGKNHPEASGPLANLALLLKDTSQFDEAESLYRRAIMIDEASFGRDHPHVALDLNNLARLLQDTNRLGEAEPLMRRALAIFLAFQRDTSHVHLHRDLVTANYEALLTAMGKSEAEIAATIAVLHHEVGLGQG